METILDVESLQKLLNKKVHSTGDVIDVLPFSTKSSREIRGQFNDCLGEFVRNICNLKLSAPKQKREQDLPFVENKLVRDICSKIEYEPDVEYDLERFLSAYLFKGEKKINLVHPYLYNYISPPEKDTLKKYALFMRDVLIQGDQGIAELFNNKTPDDIVTEIILGNLELEQGGNNKGAYTSLLNVVSDTYREDVLFLGRHKNYFLKVFPLITHFYTFMYVCQMLIKFEEFEKADFGTISPLYFALDWEALNKRRKAADDRDSFRWIKEHSSNLFVHVHTMSQLSYNKLNEKNGSQIPFMHYGHIRRVMEKDAETSAQFVADVNNWIDIYSDLFDRVEKPEEPVTNVPEAGRTLFKCVKMGMHPDACDKYGKNIEDLGRNVFLKNRGSLGMVLNMNHDMLLLLTAVCVKDKRLPLNELFDEYAKRGVLFDRQSKKLIVETLDSLNIIDKKSDSGDSQYVKPIL